MNPVGKVTAVGREIKIFRLPLLVPLFLHASCLMAQPRIETTPAEIAAVGSWADAAFGAPQPVRSDGATRDGLVVLRKSYKVLVNRTVWDTPLTLENKQFAHGIYMDAPAALLVRLPLPASELTAQVGIDNNPDTRAAPTTSSARFHVTVADKRVFSSPVRKLRDAAMAVRVPLSGAREFILETDDGGDGRSHDQCVWADVAVKFADGSAQFLDSLPFLPRHTNRSNVPLSFIYGGQPSDALLPGWQHAHKSESDPRRRGGVSPTAIRGRGLWWRLR